MKRLLSGISKLLVVVAAFFTVSLCEQSVIYDTALYYPCLSVTASIITFLSASFCACFASRSLLGYSLVYMIASLLYAVMIFESGFYALEHIFYDYSLNYSLILIVSDILLILSGVWDVITSIFVMHRNSRNSDDSSTLRMGVH